MSVKCKFHFGWLTIIALFTLVNIKIRTNGESSEEYLQKVMIELQELNVPSVSKVYDSLPSGSDTKEVIYNRNNNQQNPHRQHINTNTRQNSQKYDQAVQHYGFSPTEKLDLDHAHVKITPAQHYRVPPPVITKMYEPEALGFTRAELAAMYKNALEKGSAISLASLTNALASGTTPQVTDTHLEIPVKQPMYQYYFFPLKTFAAELTNNHGYKTIPASAFENTEAATTGQHQMMHPLFVAISTFVSMALIFVMGMIFLPKLAQYGVIHAREIRNDSFHLMRFITEAVDRYYMLEKYAKYHFESNRRSHISRLKRRRKRREAVGSWKTM